MGNAFVGIYLLVGSVGLIPVVALASISLDTAAALLRAAEAQLTFFATRARLRKPFALWHTLASESCAPHMLVVTRSTAPFSAVITTKVYPDRQNSVNTFIKPIAR